MMVVMGHAPTQDGRPSWGRLTAIRLIERRA